MSKLYYGSINISDILDHAKELHSAFNKSQKNGKVYANISVWLNDEPDKYGNIMAIKLAATKEALEKDEEQGKIYIGNCKESEDQPPKALDEKDAKTFTQIADDLPF